VVSLFQTLLTCIKRSIVIKLLKQEIIHHYHVHQHCHDEQPKEDWRWTHPTQGWAQHWQPWC